VRGRWHVQVPVNSNHGSDAHAQALAREAIERLVDYDDWFVREVENGLSQIDSVRTLPHDEVGSRLQRRLTGKAPGFASWYRTSVRRSCPL